MPTWNSSQYLRFGSERTQPAVDLAARVAIDTPARITDLGCGPGNSTEVLSRRWPNAALTGVDSSAAMLATARTAHPDWTWVEADIATWEPEADARPDVVFANASLQWVPDHARLFPRLLDTVSPGGALAVQVPANFDAPPHRVMRELGASPAWRSRFPQPPREWHTHAPAFYYDTLAPVAARVELWCTDYVHILDDIDAIVEWYRGTGLRPWLDALPDDATRQAFTDDYRQALVPYFAPRGDGRLLFPFRRLFVIAYRA